MWYAVAFSCIFLPHIVTTTYIVIMDSILLFVNGTNCFLNLSPLFCPFRKSDKQETTMVTDNSAKSIWSICKMLVPYNWCGYVGIRTNTVRWSMTVMCIEIYIIYTKCNRLKNTKCMCKNETVTISVGIFICHATPEELKTQWNVWWQLLTDTISSYITIYFPLLCISNMWSL